jgi:pilus assembly protein TadC
MSLSERDLQVLAELEHDLGSLSAGARLRLLIQASRAAWGGLLVPAVAFAAGAGLLVAGLLVGAAAGEVMLVAGIAAISYATYAGVIANPGPCRSRKRT